MRLKHLLLVTVEDAADPSSWSGTAYHLAQALGRNVEKITLLSRLPVHKTLMHGALRAVLGRERYPLWRTKPALIKFAAMLDVKVQEVRPDAVLSISSQAIVRSAMEVPTFMVSDTPWKTWRESYSQFEPEPWYSRQYGTLEAEAAQRSTGLFFASDFGVREAARLYGPAAAPAISVPFGANLRPDSGFDIDGVIDARCASDTIELLYIGKDWERKGGPLAVAAADALRGAGRKVRLHIVGCSPGGLEGRDHVQVHGLLRVGVPEERAQLIALCKRCQFLIVPTRAECFGIVFAEGQSFGLVPITRRIHATGDIVLDGETGRTLPEAATATDYADVITSLFDNEMLYRSTALAAYRRAIALFDWDRAAVTMLKAMEDSIAPSGVRGAR